MWDQKDNIIVSSLSQSIYEPLLSTGLLSKLEDLGYVYWIFYSLSGIFDILYLVDITLTDHRPVLRKKSNPNPKPLCSQHILKKYFIKKHYILYKKHCKNNDGNK